ncbi:hypothetical protein M422DRAFT_223669 [Sphaerobolus stellatus SS14]|nr:hypothetical protein M422DRAFT_223669 [Sphaerobolus stellatus SS14]
MPRRVTIKYVSLRSSLVNLPIGMYGPLVENRVRPQSLVVHLTSTSLPKPVSVHLGWTGMASASSIAQWQSGGRTADRLETVEIDPQLAASLGFAEGSTVEIGLLHDRPVAKSVSTEPISSDDWEILELHAGYVEENFLSQVRAASVGQEIDVWVLGRTRVRFTVVSYDPPGSSVLLSTNTEVSIAPKLRAKSTSKLNAAPTKTSSAREEAVQSRPAPKKNLGGKVILRTLPKDYLSTSTDETLTDEELGAFVSPSTFEILTGERLLSSKAGQSQSRRRFISIHRLRPPAPPPNPKNQQRTDLSKSQALLQSRILHKAGGTVGPTDNEVSQSPTQSNVFAVQWSKDIPDYHVFLRRRDDVEDWDLVRFLGPFENIFFNSKRRRRVSISQSPKLAGVDQILEQCHASAVNSFAVQAQSLGIPALLLCGRSGSGRTSIVKAMIKRLAEDRRVLAYTHYVDLTKYSEESVPALKALFQYWLDLGKWHRPSVIALDNLERIIPAEVEHTDSFRSRHLAEHFLSVFGSKSAISGVVVVATCQSQTAIHPLLLSSHTFSTIIPLKPPNKDARRDILSSLVNTKLEQSSLQIDPENPLNYISLATTTEGYLATDLHDLVSRAIHQATIRAAKDKAETVLREADFHSAQQDFTPLSLRDVKLQKSEISWADIGGLHETRRVLRETLEWPTKYAAIFANCPLRLRSGLLLYGFPGCGKTLLASAVAKECGLNFISVKGPEILNKYIGASEKSVRDLFERASAAKPCVLFFDEFDSIAPKRGHDSTGVTDRVVNQLLTQMDGAEGLDGVYVLAATSRPDLIDSALLRPGRLDKSLLCNIPDKEERKEIMQAVSKKIELAPDIDLDYYAEATEGFSGADLQALIYNAHLEVVHSTLDNTSYREKERSDASHKSKLQYTSFGGDKEQKVLSRAEQDAVTRRLNTMLASRKPNVEKEKSSTTAPVKHKVRDEHLRKSLQTVRPSVPEEERYRLNRMQVYQGFVAERGGQLPVPPESGGIGNRASMG